MNCSILCFNKRCICWQNSFVHIEEFHDLCSCFGNGTKEEETTVTFGTQMKTKNKCKIAIGNPERKKPYVDVGVSGRIIRSRIFRR